MADIFLSYASEDRQRVRPLVESLEAEGWNVWWDQHIQAGPAFRNVIAEAIQTCRCMVVVWSNNSVQSDFVIDEATEGKERNILVPALLDEVRPPLGFRTAQAASLTDWPNDRRNLEGLFTGIRDTLAGARADVPSTKHQAPSTKRAKRLALWGFAFAAIATLVSWQLDPFASRSIRNASIAVLPLANLSQNPGETYFVHGMHDALISSLSKISSLRVTSATSVGRVDKSLTIPQIASQLGVASIVEGSVIREGDHVRIVVQLIDATADEYVWTQTYDRELTSALALQSEIAASIAEAIELTLTPEDERNVSAYSSIKSETLEAYLRGRFQLQKETLRGYRRGIAILREAAANDPDSALAHAGIAYGYSMLGHSYYPESAYPQARTAALKALALDDTLPEVHLAMGMYNMYFEWNWQAAERSLLRALELNPSLVSAHYHYAWLLELLGRTDDAIKHGERTGELNPLSAFYSGNLADQYRNAGQFDDAIREARNALDLSSDYPTGWKALGDAYVELGRFDDAIAAHEHLRDRYFWSWALGYSYARAGRIDEARAIAASIEQKPDNAIPLVLINAAIGNKPEMYRWLGEAREAKLPWYPWLVAWFPQLKPHYDDPELQRLSKELKLQLR